MSRAERKAMRNNTAAPSDAGGGTAGEGGEDVGWEPGGGPVQLVDVENIRLRRQLLEKWLLEPFFAQVVRGCVVRIGLQASPTPGEPPSTLYRVGEVAGVKEFEEHPYMMGGRRTTKRFLLDFGESQQWYPMSSVSNQPFEELELRSWQAVCEVSGRPHLTNNQLRVKIADLQRANDYQYSEADLTKRIEEQRKSDAQAGKQPMLTTRQKMMMQKEGGGGGLTGVARPMKFQRNVLGQAIVGEQSEQE